MTTTRVRWMVGIMVVGLSLAGGFASAAESQAVSGQMVMTGGHHGRSEPRESQTVSGQMVMTGDYHYCKIYIISGQGTATIDGQEFPFIPGTVLYIPNGVPYSIKADEGNLAYKMKEVK
jgi:hypothetical protein